MLGEAGITNNFPDLVTSVIPHERGRVPSVRDRLDVDVKYPTRLERRL